MINFAISSPFARSRSRNLKRYCTRSCTGVRLQPGHETLAALAQCRKRGVRGGAVHDFLHAYAAELHECKTIFTGNTADFIAVTGLKVLKP